jgi:hypothetical protein
MDDNGSGYIDRRHRFVRSSQGVRLDLPSSTQARAHKEVVAGDKQLSTM